MQVQTNKGLIDIEKLQVIDETSINNTMRVTVTKWLLDGELVRQDLYGNILSGIGISAEQGNIE